MKNKRLPIRRYTACLLMIVMIVTQYISPYAQADYSSEGSQSYEGTIENEENNNKLKKAAEGRNNTATMSEPEEKDSTSKEDIDILEEEQYNDEIPLYDDRYGDATASAPEIASVSNALRIAGNTYTLQYRAFVDGSWQIIAEEEVCEGDDGSPPEVPEREGWTFAGWRRSDPYVNVQANCTVYATYVQGDVTMHVCIFRPRCATCTAI